MKDTLSTSAKGLRASRGFLVLGLAAATFGSAWPVSAPSAAVRNPEDLLIVDCLLPGQVRKLGRVSTFMTARRPIRTTQADCEIRGGEYVSYDRANYQTALKVWMQQAEQGDAEAQNYVGEIYAKGLGTDPDYAKAASWFEKSAAQGNKRARINLGYLYEEGLGVPRDLGKALSLYREASGATDELLFASTVRAQSEAAQQQISALEATVAEQRRETESLRAENQRLRNQLDERRRQLRDSSAQLEQARAKLVEQQASLAQPGDAAQLRKLKDELGAQEQRLAAERAQLERDRASYAEKLAADRAKLAQLRSEERALDQKLSGAGGDAAALKADLDRVRSAASELALALDDASNRMGSLEAQLSANEQRLAAEQARFEAERKQMQAALAASQQDRELLLLLEQQLSQKQREVSQQREQIVALERQVLAEPSAVGAVADLGGGAGPVLEILEPALTVTRGRPAAMVRPAPNSSDVVGKVIARGGLTRLEVNGQPVSVAANGLFRISVPVAAEGSNVQVAAIDKAGTRTALEFLLLPTPGAGRAGAPAMAAKRAVPPGVKLGRYHALVIGNDAYAAYPKLSSAVNDASAIGALLSKRYGFRTEVLRNATRLDILAALNTMREELGPEDNLLVYFAGHGELDPATGQGYWVPVDARPGTPAGWIPNRAISDILNTVEARHVMVVADSCYSGAMTRASVPAFNAAIGDDKWAQWVRTMTGSRSRTALVSGGLAPVPDASAGGHSLFARAVIAALEDNNGLLEGQRLFREVSATMAAAAAESTLPQAPEYAPIQFAGHEAGEFFFKPGA